jgi:hypothetical protein
MAARVPRPERPRAKMGGGGGGRGVPSGCAAFPHPLPFGGGLSRLDRLPPLTHVLGRLILYYITFYYFHPTLMPANPPAGPRLLQAAAPRGGLEIKESKEKGVHVRDLSQAVVKDARELLKKLQV